MKALLVLTTAIAICGCGGGGSSTPDGGDTDTGAGPPPGSLLWAQHIGGSDYLPGEAWGALNEGHSVAALSDGTFYAGGRFIGVAVFGAGTGNEVALQSAGGAWDADAFIGRWNPDGTPEWVLGLGGEEPGLGRIEVDPPNDSISDFQMLPDDTVFARLWVEDDANIDPLGDEPVVPADDAKSLAVRYGPDGRLVERFEPGLGGPAELFGVAYQDFSRFLVWPDGSFAISGGYTPINEALTLGEGEPNETTLTPNPAGLGMDVVAVFNADGTLRWAVKMENGDPLLTTSVSELAIGPDGAIYAVGFFGDGEAVFEGTDGSETSLHFIETGTDTTGNFFAKWSPVGVVEWVKQIPDEPSPFFVRDDETIVLMDSFKNGWVLDPGGPGETAVDQSGCENQWCFFSVEATSDGSSFTLRFIEGGGSSIAMRADGSFALADNGGAIMAYSADYELEWTATIESTEDCGGVWIHDIAVLADGSVVVTGDYSYGATFGAGEPNETTIHGVCDECKHGAFLARYAW